MEPFFSKYIFEKERIEDENYIFRLKNTFCTTTVNTEFEGILSKGQLMFTDYFSPPELFYEHDSSLMPQLITPFDQVIGCLYISKIKESGNILVMDPTDHSVILFITSLPFEHLKFELQHTNFGWQYAIRANSELSNNKVQL